MVFYGGRVEEEGGLSPEGWTLSRHQKWAEPANKPIFFLFLVKKKKSLFPRGSFSYMPVLCRDLFPQ